jgi:hypothetical protein
MNNQPIRVPLPGIVKQDSVGLGDVVKRVLDTAGIKLENCQCEDRRQYLNGLLQFTKDKPQRK